MKWKCLQNSLFLLVLCWNKTKQIQHKLKSTSFNIYIVSGTISQGKMWIYQHMQTLSKWSLKRWICFLVQQEGSQCDAGGGEWEWNCPVCHHEAQGQMVPCACRIHCMWSMLMCTGFALSCTNILDPREYITHCTHSLWGEKKGSAKQNQIDLFGSS